jgi:two-component system chemotaxis sensor kinase CheA
MSQEGTPSHRFIVEAREHLAAMSSTMIALERNQGEPHAVIEQLLRAAHSIKGGAGFIGRRNIERLAHAMEEAIENIRDGIAPRNAEVVDTLLAVLDRITAMVDNLDHSDADDISEPLARLRPLIQAGAAREQPLASPRAAPATDSIAIATGDFPLSNRVLASWPTGSPFLYGIRFDWFECEREHALSPADIAQRLERAGSVLESRTDVAGARLSQGLPSAPLWYMAVMSSSLDLKQFTQKLRIPCAMIVTLREKETAQPATVPPAQETRARSAAAATSMRISVPLVDRMMALAGELVLVRNQAMRSTDPGDAPFRRLLRRLDSVTNELQDAALRMRTQPVGTLFDRFPRVVRDLARQLGKQIEVEIKGAEVELDKTILELLADPLTHLIRNCCDHGIELPEKRSASGKPPGGRIALSARQERGQMVIEIRDDGRGIDAQAVKRKALEQGVKRGDELERMSDRQVYDLILLSGFSTAAKVTDLSGRGVGMDVVKTNLDQIGGVVEIDSAVGRGTVFTLRLPLTLAIMPCLLLASDGQCYAVPQRDVDQIELLDPGSSRRGVERNHEGEVLRWRGRLLPVVRLREVLRSRAPLDARAQAEIAERHQSDQTRAYAAVIRSGSRRFVLVFDEVVGSENIVVKSLHPLLRALAIYAATTILGDGSVALILNGEGIARHSGIFERPGSEEIAAFPSSSAGEETQPVLLFRYGPAELLAAPMDAVRRVVMITPDRIERIGDRELVNVDGAATNVLRLDRFLNVSPCANSNRLFLILPRNTDSPLGLLVSEIVDTPTLAIQLDDRAFKADGVLGSAMVRGQIVVFIDVNRIIQMWQQMHQPAQATLPSLAGTKILVIDDTQFFQKLVADHLRSQSYEVKVAGDGSAGLAMVKAERFDLVVCDIEMPIMDGLTFARRLREDPQLAALPLVALTTLNTPESRATAKASGFDAYEVKLDRQTLLATVKQLLARSHQPAALPGTTTHA